MPLAPPGTDPSDSQQGDQAVELIQAFVDRRIWASRALGDPGRPGGENETNLTGRTTLPSARVVAGTLREQIALATFLARSDQVKDGLNICEPLWKTIQRG